VEFANAARPSSGLSELDRYALLSRVIESEFADAKLPQ
jgi:hypothetical protein